MTTPRLLHARSTRELAWFLSLMVMTLPFLAVGSGAKRFVVWDQILFLVGHNPWELLLSGQAHGLRYLIMQPCILMAEATGLDENLVFSWMIAFMVVGIAVMVAKAAALMASGSSREWIYSFPAACFSIFFISLFQNGRLMLAFLGCAIIGFRQLSWILAEQRSLGRFLGEHFLGLLLLSVSSGSFMVGIVTFALFSLFLLRARSLREWNPDRRDRAIVAGFLLLVLMFLPVISIFVTKNLDFYGGGMAAIIPMLGHGPGQFVLALSGGSLVILAVLAIVVGWSFVLVIGMLLRRRVPFTVGLLPIVAAVCVGPFGYSTLLTGIPAVLAVCIAACPQARFRTATENLANLSVMRMRSAHRIFPPAQFDQQRHLDRFMGSN